METIQKSILLAPTIRPRFTYIPMHKLVYPGVYPSAHVFLSVALPPRKFPCPAELATIVSLFLKTLVTENFPDMFAVVEDIVSS